MKVADLMILLRADSAELQKGFRTSEKSTASAVRSMKKSLSAIPALMATGLGVAGFTAIMDKVVHSSQTMGDGFDNAMNSMKASVDTFFFSLSSGKWDTFENGLTDVIKRSKEFAQILDDLDSRNISTAYVKARWMPEYKAGMVAAGDASLSDKERFAGVKRAQSAQDKMMEADQKLLFKQIEKINAFYKLRTGVEPIDIEAIGKKIMMGEDISKEMRLLDQLMQHSIVGDDKSTIDAYNNFVSQLKTELKEKYTKGEWKSRLGEVYYESSFDKEGYDSEFSKRLSEIYSNEDTLRDLKFLSAAIEISDKENKEITDELYKVTTDYSTSIAQQRKLNSLANSISKNAKAKADKDEFKGKTNGEAYGRIEPTGLSINDYDINRIEENQFQRADEVAMWDDSAAKNFDGTKEWTRDESGNFVKKWKVKPEMEIDRSGFHEAIDQFKAAAQEFIAEASRTIAGGIGDTIGDLSAELGKSFMGGGSFTKVLAEGFANVLERVGRMAIEYSSVMTALKKAFEASIIAPEVLLPIGIGMIATAAAMRTALENETPALASGGLAFGPTYAMVGDNARASVDPEVIAPLSKLRTMITPMEAMPVVNLSGSLRVSGSDLEFILERNQQRMKLQRG